MKCLTLIIRSNRQEVSNNCLSLQVVCEKERSMNMDNYMELDAMKAALAREILNTDSSEILNKVRKVFERSKKSEETLPPCRYTVEELKERVHKGVQDARAGKGVTTEELLKQSEAW